MYDFKSGPLFDITYIAGDNRHVSSSINKTNSIKTKSNQILVETEKKNNNITYAYTIRDIAIKIATKPSNIYSSGDQWQLIRNQSMSWVGT